MLKTKVTHRVDSHHTNPRYRCLLVDFLCDPTFHFEIVNGRLVKADLTPTDGFVLELVRLLAAVSPMFRAKLLDFAIRL